MAAELLDKVKLLYRSAPPALRPTLGSTNNKNEITFSKLESKIIVLPSTENVGKSYTLHNVLVSELAMWENSEEKMGALEPSVPVTGKIVIDSTPKGCGNKYHQLWVNDDNGYVHKRYSWQEVYSKQEIEKIRKTMDPMLFAQEYECAFLTSGRTVFDQVSVERQRINILKVGDKIKYIDSDKSEKEWTVKTEDGWTHFYPPIKGHRYVCGADTSEGVSGGDYSAAMILDKDTGDEVACYRGLIYPDKWGEELNKEGRKWNNCLMTVEQNNMGVLTLSVLKKLSYPALYYRQTNLDKIYSETTDRIGWRTTAITKPVMIQDLGTAIREDAIKIHDKGLIDECTVFIYNSNGDMCPTSGFFDDRICAASFCIQGAKQVIDPSNLGQLNYSEYLPRGFSY
jgi:hypothetical protein